VGLLFVLSAGVARMTAHTCYRMDRVHMSACLMAPNAVSRIFAGSALRDLWRSAPPVRIESSVGPTLILRHWKQLELMRLFLLDV